MFLSSTCIATHLTSHHRRRRQHDRLLSARSSARDLTSAVRRIFDKHEPSSAHSESTGLFHCRLKTAPWLKRAATFLFSIELNTK